MKKKELIKLDLSFGSLPEGWQYCRPNGFNSLSYPWKLKNESVEEAYSGFLLNRIDGEERLKFMDEAWRVLIPGGKISIIVPYWSHMKTTIDPHFKYPGFSEWSFNIYNKEWRKSQGMENVCKCDFDITSLAHNVDDETKNRGTDTQPFWVRHYTNSVADIHAFLTKRT